MADVNVTVESPMTPEQAWVKASDLARFGEWMTIFDGWRSELPAELAVGVRVDSMIKVLGFRNVVGWTITEYDPPRAIALLGEGVGGVRITLLLTVAPLTRGRRSESVAGSALTCKAKIGGGVLSGIVGTAVAYVLTSDVKQSVRNLAGTG